MTRQRKAFTLIELLVVIAIIAILSAAIMPAFSAANDRARVTECKSHLTTIGLALRMWQDDHASYPATLQDLYRQGYVTDDAVLRCSKTGADYYYHAPAAGGRSETPLCACVSPDTASGQRPHGFRTEVVILQAGGGIREDRD
jgi:prepilin-type N-terminal cleavage/methylation domain-containing protein